MKLRAGQSKRHEVGAAPCPGAAETAAALLGLLQCQGAVG